MVESMEDDLARLTFNAMCEYKDGLTEKLISFVLPRLLVRWDCVLKAGDNELAISYKAKAYIALAVLLSKHGFSDVEITKKAISGIDYLNKEVILSDTFEKQSSDIKNFISATPKPLKRKPSVKVGITFYRAKEAISIQIGKDFYAAYIHKISDNNGAAIIEVYDAVFDKIPAKEQLKNLKGRGQKYDDGSERISFFRIAGMKFLPDPANQIHIIGSSIAEPPLNSHLEEAIGLYAMSDLFRLQEIINRMFRD